MNRIEYYRKKMIMYLPSFLSRDIQPNGVLDQLIYAFSAITAEQEEIYGNQIDTIKKEIRANRIMNWLNLSWLCIITTLLMINWSQ